MIVSTLEVMNKYKDNNLKLNVDKTTLILFMSLETIISVVIGNYVPLLRALS